MDAPDDANDLRGFYFGLLVRKPLTWVAIAIATIVAGAAGAALLSPALGAAAAGTALLLSLLVVFGIADSRSEGAFFEVYAAQHDLLLHSGKGRLPPMTPLLRKGDDRYTESALRGQLADGVDGILALYTYEEESTDGKGNRQTSYYRYTVGLVEVPECAPHVSELLCQGKFGLRSLEKLEDAFRSKQRVKLESEALDERYEIFAGKDQDQVWLRRLFSPTFVVWLGEAAPKKFAFELVAGFLCCYVNGHKKSAAELDEIRAASAVVAKRLREEALETS